MESRIRSLSQKKSGCAISHMMACLLHRKLWDTRIIAYSEKKFISVFIGLYKCNYYLIFRKQAQLIHICTQNKRKIGGNVTSCNQSK